MYYCEEIKFIHSAAYYGLKSVAPGKNFFAISARTVSLKIQSDCISQSLDSQVGSLFCTIPRSQSFSSPIFEQQCRSNQPRRAQIVL